MRPVAGRALGGDGFVGGLRDRLVLVRDQCLAQHPALYRAGDGDAEYVEDRRHDVDDAGRQRRDLAGAEGVALGRHPVV